MRPGTFCSGRGRKEGTVLGATSLALTEGEGGPCGHMSVTTKKETVRGGPRRAGSGARAVTESHHPFRPTGQRPQQKPWAGRHPPAGQSSGPQLLPSRPRPWPQQETVSTPRTPIPHHPSAHDLCAHPWATQSGTPGPGCGCWGERWGLWPGGSEHPRLSPGDMGSASSGKITGGPDGLGSARPTEGARGELGTVHFTGTGEKTLEHTAWGGLGNGERHA